MQCGDGVELNNGWVVEIGGSQRQPLVARGILELYREGRVEEGRFAHAHAHAHTHLQHGGMRCAFRCCYRGFGEPLHGRGLDCCHSTEEFVLNEAMVRRRRRRRHVHLDYRYFHCRPRLGPGRFERARVVLVLDSI
jgi:hypothetical protein